MLTVRLIRRHHYPGIWADRFTGPEPDSIHPDTVARLRSQRTSAMTCACRERNQGEEKMQRMDRPHLAAVSMRWMSFAVLLGLLLGCRPDTEVSQTPQSVPQPDGHWVSHETHEGTPTAGPPKLESPSSPQPPKSPQPTSSSQPANHTATAPASHLPPPATSSKKAPSDSEGHAGNGGQEMVELLEDRWYTLYYGIDDTSSPVESSTPEESGSSSDPSTAPSLFASEDPLFRTSRKIGHMQIRVARQPWGSHQLVRTDMLQHVTMQRYEQEVAQQILLSSLETESGQVLRMRSQLNNGGEAMTTDIVTREDTLHLTVSTLGQEESLELDWQSDWRGFFAEHQTLRRQPLTAGERREVKTFVPVLNVIGDLRLRGKELEWIETPFGPERLLRIESQLTTPQITLESTLWMDPEGTVRKYVVRQGSMTAYQTLKRVALAPNDDVDLYEAIQIQVADPIPQPHSKRSAVYRLRLKSGRDPAEFFFAGPAQQLDIQQPGVARVTVRAIRPDDPREIAPPDEPPQDTDLAANNLIQTEDPIVRSLAADVLPNDSNQSVPDDWEWALACEKFVHRLIERKVLTEAFRSAAEVARTRQGDCTEHAVLLAALCRVRGIPARVATGLVAVGDQYGFHMWNEVWIDDRWIPLDATLARGGIGAGHLKLTDSSLEGVSPFAALAPVLQILGDVELEVLAHE
jgi:hypothetical protein